MSLSESVVVIDVTDNSFSSTWIDDDTLITGTSLTESTLIVTSPVEDFSPWDIV